MANQTTTNSDDYDYEAAMVEFTEDELDAADAIAEVASRIRVVIYSAHLEADGMEVDIANRQGALVELALAVEWPDHDQDVSVVHDVSGAGAGVTVGDGLGVDDADTAMDIEHGLVARCLEEAEAFVLDAANLMWAPMEPETKTFTATLNFSNSTWDEEALIEDCGDATDAGETWFSFALESSDAIQAEVDTIALLVRDGREYSVQSIDIS